MLAMIGRFVIVSMVALCFTATLAQGQDISPRRVLGRYQQSIWQDRHGLPQNTITSMVRTRDGYMWLGTYEGAVRFDGVRFTVFDTSNTREFRSNWINAVLEDRQGRLWFGTDRGGLVRFAEGAFTRFGARDGLADDRVTVLHEDRSGTLWIGTRDHGLSRLRDGRFTTYTTDDGLPASRIKALAEDGDGNIWIGTSSGLARIRQGRVTRYPVKDGLPADDVLALCWDKDGRLWIGTERGLTWLDQGLSRGATTAGVDDESVTAIFQDREGSVWIGTREHGLYRFVGDRIASYGTRDGLPGDTVMAIYQDPDGALWVGTSANGLARFKDPRFHVISTEDGLVHDAVRGINEDSSGAIWIGSERGLSRLDRGLVTTFMTRQGLADDTVRSIAEDATGSIWIGTVRGLSRYRDGHFESWSTRDGLPNDVVVALLADGDGSLWIGTEQGLARFRQGRFAIFTTRDGLANNHVEALYQDRDGSLWIGTNNGGMSRFKDGRFTSWSTDDGLAHNRVIAFHEDDAGGLWIGTLGGGLTRFKHGAFTVVTTQHGLYDNLAFRILADDHRNLWMVCNRGIFRASVDALNAFADGKTRTVPSYVYGIADGMRSREGNGGHPAGWKTRDGRLWFPTVAGVVIVDPGRQHVDPPRIAIERITVDRQPLSLADGVSIMPGQENLEIQYTALSWDRPDQITFKYRLEGFDREWVDAGRRRTAYYARLPPGAYTFQVMGDNGEGIWNTTGRRLAIVVQPAFYQTWWFSTVTAGAALALAATVWQHRMRQYRRAEEAQHVFSRRLIASQEAERKRIAAELHDSLGQHLLMIKNRALLGSASPMADTASQSQFDEIAASAGHSLEEVRQIAYNLRPYHLDRLGLTQALAAMVESVAASSGMRLEARLTPIDRLFPKDAEITIFRIVQESLNNIVKHSHASLGIVTVSQQADVVTLTIEDNGTGFDVTDISTRRDAGFGLAGMTERVRMLGGVHRIDSVTGQGATVTITLPASTRTSDADRHV
jgi:ligand-binding sensor domain-containing protein/signal transduction histidine kinase